MADSEFQEVLIQHGQQRRTPWGRVRWALAALRQPVVPPDAIVAPYPPERGPVRVYVGAGGRLDIGHHLYLGPDCKILSLDGGGFVIEVPQSISLEYEELDEQSSL